ncbi:alpha/beta hydrolase [filamentous cyanobacterium CCP3]|nr:alpha/beta hydrolase [filamentous cyanobacterium CCP3]
MAFITVAAEVNLFINDWGSGKPIVFVHGFPFSHRIFEPSMLALASQGYRAIGLDLRGFGQSTKTWDGCDYDTWASDIYAVIKALDLQDATLVGFSMGGAIAAHYAATLNDPRVTRLVLLGAAAPIAAPTPEDKATISGFIRGILADAAGFAATFIQQAFYQPLSPEQLQFLTSLGTQASLRTLVRSQEELRDRDLVAELTQIQLPTLICHGVHDKVVPLAAGEAQNQLIPDSALLRFEASGHGIFYEEKNRLSQELLNFVG